MKKGMASSPVRDGWLASRKGELKNNINLGKLNSGEMFNSGEMEGGMFPNDKDPKKKQIYLLLAY